MPTNVPLHLWRLALYLDRPLSQSKFARGVLRFDARRQIACVIDVNAQLAADGDAEAKSLVADRPIVRSLGEALKLNVDAVVIGVCPIDADQRFPDAMLNFIEQCIEHAVMIVNPLHVTPWDDARLRSRPDTWDRFVNLRASPPRRLFADNELTSFRVLTCGNDCSVGKMTTALTIVDELRKMGKRAAFLATGQTGMLISGGKGLAVDHVEGDFMSGAVEEAILELECEADIIVVEGQASLLHPAYSGVTAALLHGTRPHAIVLCSDPWRRRLKFYSERPVPSLLQEWRAIEALCAAGSVPVLVGVAQPGGEGHYSELGVPCCDPLNAGGTKDISLGIRELSETSKILRERVEA
jgi:uncharacterized NAD-dependent epimerase/dehydratase family protein